MRTGSSSSVSARAGAPARSPSSSARAASLPFSAASPHCARVPAETSRRFTDAGARVFALAAGAAPGDPTERVSAGAGRVSAHVHALPWLALPVALALATATLAFLAHLAH